MGYGGCCVSATWVGIESNLSRIFMHSPLQGVKSRRWRGWNEWRNLNRLSYLRFESLPKLNSLPAGLQHITTLKTLIIIDCENLETLPWWIWKLISLESLTLTGCPNLKSLPNEMRNLTSLQTLKIFDCPGLWRRCEKETGQDWHKIAHITTGTHSIHLFFYWIFCLLAEKIVENERKWTF